MKGSSDDSVWPKNKEAKKFVQYADAGSDDDADIVETNRFSSKRLNKLDEKKFRLTNKKGKFQILIQAKNKVHT